MLSRRISILIFSAACLSGQGGPVKVWEDHTVFPTYRENNPDTIPPFDQLAINGSGNYSIYPYTLRNHPGPEKYEASWRVLHLENEYLHCRILPDLGGKLFGCLDKLSGQELFYANTTIKKADTGPRGAWTAGGIETSFPIAHTRLAVSPVRFGLSTDAAGAATAAVGAIDRISGMSWQVAYTLRPGSTVLEQKVRLENAGAVRQPFQWWTNAAIRLPDHGLRLTYPMWVTLPHGAGVINSWPRNAAGVDLSNTADYVDTMGLFAYRSREPFFAAYNPEARVGVAHWADPKEVPGKKVWVWGGRESAYRDRYSDDHSGYTEIQAGLLPTQEAMEFLEPKQSRAFTELWIPSREMSGVTRATPDAVLFVERTKGGALRFEVTATHAIPNAQLRIFASSQAIYEKSVALTPREPFRGETPAAAGVKHRVELRDQDGKLLLAHQEDTYDAIAASEVKLLTAPPKAAPKTGAEETALANGEADELVRVLDRAALNYHAALSARPKSAALRKASARLSIGLGRFAEAQEALAATPKEAVDGEIQYYRGIASYWLGDDGAAQASWSAAAQDARFGTAAQFELARSLSRAGDRKGAVELLHGVAEHGLARAAALEAVLLRRLGRKSEAAALVKKRLAETPTDLLLRYEGGLLNGEDPALWRLLASDPEWILDLVDDYFSLGLYEEPLNLLGRKYPEVSEVEREAGGVPPQDYPLTAYYRGYARMRLGGSGAEDFAQASGLSTLYVHPSRNSSAAVLEAAVKQSPADATAHYLLGCMLLNRRMTDEALAEWELAKPAGSRIPSFYETYAMVLNTVKNDRNKAEGLLQEAMGANPSDSGLERTFKRIHGAAAGGGAVNLGTPNFASAAEGANYIFGALALGHAQEAGQLFERKNFPGDKQPAETRQAYIETQLQLMLVYSKGGKCNNLELAFATFGAEDPGLPFTFSGFGAFVKEARTQFYFGAVEAACGDRKAAAKRWAKVAKMAAPFPSANFAFPLLAAAVLHTAGSTRSLEVALEKVKTSTVAEAGQGLVLYAQGVLLRAAGREAEAAKAFAEGAKTGSPYTRYLNGAAQYDPPLPQM